MTTVDLARQQLLIGGDWTGARSGREYQQTFPFTGAAVGTAAAAGRDEARAAVERGRGRVRSVVAQRPRRCDGRSCPRPPSC